VDALSDDILINGGILLWLANNQVKDTASITLVSGELGFNSRTETIKNLSIQGGNANSGGGGNGTAITITDTLSVSSTGTLGLNSAGQWSATTVAFSGGARTVLTTTGNNTTTMTRVTVGAGGLSMTGQTVALNKGTADSAKGSELLLNGNVTSTGTNSFTFGNSVGSSQVNLGTTVTWETTNLADVTTINPVVTGSGGLTKTGLGALKLYGAEANTYQGTTTVSAGTLNLGKTAGVDAIARDVLVNGGTLDWDISNQLNDLVNITMTSGALKFDGLNETFASLTQSGGNTNPGGGVNGGTITITGTLRVSGGSMVNLNSSGVWTVGKADFTGYSGTVLNLNGNATTMNRFIVGAGGLVLSGQTISLTKATLVTNKGSELVLDGDVTASGNNAITSPGSNGVSQVNLDGAVRTWNVTGGTTTSSAAFVSNTLTPTGDGATPTAGGLIKSGAGSLVLTGDNTYTGATTVSAGTLLVHGTLNGTSGVAVEAGTFGGRGVVTAPVTVAAGASLQAGDGNTGTTLQVDGDLSLTGTAVVKLTLGGSLAHSTLTRVGGTWALASNLAFTFTGPGVTTGFYDNLITGLLGTETWLDDMGGWQITNAGYVGQFIRDGTNVDLNITAVPEPSAALSLLGGLSLLLGVTRRQRRAPGK
jgi:autotransporter-associated beta strand protein